MSTNAAEERPLAPAYVSSGAFLGFLAEHAESMLPECIDRSLMPNMSGGTQSHLLASMRFLRLIDRDGKPTAAFSRLHEVWDDETARKKVLAHIIDNAYSSVLGNVDIDRATPKTLRDCFRSAGADGSTLNKAIRFYLRLLEEIGTAVPQRLSRGAATASGTTRANGKGSAEPRRKVAASSANRVMRETSDRKEPPGEHVAGTRRYPLYFKNKPAGALIVPDDLDATDCRVIELQLEVLKAYLQTGEE